MFLCGANHFFDQNEITLMLNNERNVQECESSTGRFEGNGSRIVVLLLGTYSFAKASEYS